MRTLGIVTARGGSKGVPRKNVRPLCGRPLLAYTADVANEARRLDRVVLSTDDEEIAKVGRQCGLEVPFLRPPELARDDTPTLPVLQHAVRQIEESGERFDAVCLLQPTHPLRTVEELDGCIELLEASAADCVISVLRVPDDYNPHWVYFRAADGRLTLATGEATPIPRRQSLPPAFHRSGSVYVTRRDVLVEQDSLYGARMVGYESDPSRHVNIDTPEDWAEAEKLVAKLLGRQPNP